MSSLASYVAGGLALTLAVDFALPLPRAGSAMDLLAGSGFSGPDARANNAVDRTLKGDRLTAVAPAKRAQTKIASVEIVGLTNTAVVYRDGEGRTRQEMHGGRDASIIIDDPVAQRRYLLRPDRKMVLNLPSVAIPAIPPVPQ